MVEVVEWMLRVDRKAEAQRRPYRFAAGNGVNGHSWREK